MEQEQPYKMGFFKRIKWAIFHLEDYDLFAVERTKKALGYFIKLIILFTAVICVGIAYQFGENFYQTINLIDEKMPNFTFNDGKLEAEQDAEILSEKIGVILVNKSNDAESKEKSLEKIRTYTSGILFLEDKIAVKLPASEGIVIYEYSQLVKQYNLQNFTKQQAIDYMRSINKVSLYASFYFASFIYLFSIYLITTFMDVILLSILGILTSFIARIKLKYLPTLNISVYSLTLPILLNAIYIVVNCFTGFEIKYFQVMYNAVAYIYIVTAILMIKSEMMKQEIELMKLEEEQKKVKEEIERQKEEEKQKEEQKRREKEKKEKKDQEKPSRRNSGRFKCNKIKKRRELFPPKETI